jgi:predicted 2-oxoglutarate/Fe(II)-dependent dioxygenase YbiX
MYGDYMKTLEDFVMVIPDAVNKDLCLDAVKELQDSSWSKHDFVQYDNSVDKTKQKSPCETIITHGTNKDDIPQNELIMKEVWDTIYMYLMQHGKPHFTGWAGFTRLKWNRYKTGTNMEQHVDHIDSIFNNNWDVPKGIPILSIVGLLNDDFEGGEFVMFGHRKVELKAGDVLIFPSNFAWPHEVKTVTKGTRYSFVSWVY